MVDVSLVQQAYTTIQKHFIQTGRAPHFTELAAELEITPDGAKDVQKKAAEAGVGCWISHDTDYIASWAPFSNIPTQYLVRIAGKQKWYAQGGLEALAVRWLFPGKEILIEAHCLDCGEPFIVRTKDDELLEANPERIVGHITLPIRKWREVTNAFLGGHINLFRAEEHVKNWSLYDPDSEDSIMSLADWLHLVQIPMFRNRMHSDYLSRVPEYRAEFVKTIHKMGKTGPFWQVG